MSAELVTRYSQPVPRYTSYPTAPHFHAGVGNETYAGWLREVPDDAPLSLYVHTPFCDRLSTLCELVSGRAPNQSWANCETMP